MKIRIAFTDAEQAVVLTALQALCQVLKDATVKEVDRDSKYRHVYVTTPKKE